ncbi:uncharacterized protein IL334_002367 [Kwoniella shivajii]|uniref:G-patch domain-containing protein n=1 Tax=Kwoniella shivajii TaxID=564305 RepID=A0ABZ1CUK2_9TREE|nr:hypothetical protein IL334_002367 [Kwoniella shivajii]
MSYRPRSGSRSRSRSPEYRQRRYSPSRPLSPMRSEIPPPRRYDNERYPTSRGGRSPPPPPRRYDHDEPPRRGHEEYPYSTQSRRYEEDRYDEERYVPPPRQRYDDRSGGDYGSASGMIADREDTARPRRDYTNQRGEPHWERGRDIDELANEKYQSGDDYRPKRGGKGPSEPSRDVIFLGLDPELTEQDFSGYLRSEHNAVLESVKIVKDKFTGHSKCFGFAQFKTLDGAEEFVNINYPAVLMPALYAHSDPRKVKIDYSATQAPVNTGHSHEGPSHTFVHQPQYVRPAHDGMKDIGVFGGGKRVILLRGLDANTTASDVTTRISQEIARMMGRVGRELAAESTIVRVILIVDRNVRSSWGYGFVELATAELAAALVPFLLAPQHQPNGFIINYVPVAACFANPAAFIPTSAGPLGGEFVLRPSRNGGIASDTIDNPEGQWCAYWHQAGGAVETVTRGAPQIGEDGVVQLTPDHRTFLGTLAGIPPQTKAAQPSDQNQGAMGPISMAGGLQPIKIGTAGPKGKKKEDLASIIPIIGKNVLGDEEEVDMVGKDSVLLSRSKGVYIIPPTSTSRKIAKNINKWNTKQTELAAPEPMMGPNAPPRGISDVNTTLGVRRPANIATGEQGASPNVSAVAGPSKSPQSPAPVTHDFDYTDVSTLAATGKVACLLCQRQFKTEEILKKHTNQSDLHKTNLADVNVREAGMRRKAGISSSDSPSAAEASQPKYRDRAAERRVAFNQPSMPIPEESPSWQLEQAKKRKFAEGPKPSLPTPPPPAPVVEPGKDESNVGNQLLAKMGWKAGTGLGRESEGRVDPILVQQFENRAGLGASKGVEAGRWQGPGGFQQRALDMAKERYNNNTSAPSDDNAK